MHEWVGGWVRCCGEVGDNLMCAHQRGLEVGLGAYGLVFRVSGFFGCMPEGWRRAPRGLGHRV